MDREKCFRLRFGKNERLHQILRQLAFDRETSINELILDAIQEKYGDKK